MVASVSECVVRLGVDVYYDCSQRDSGNDLVLFADLQAS